MCCVRYVVFEREAREYLFSFNYSEYTLRVLTRITYTTRMLLHSQEYNSNVTKNLTRASRSNTGTEYDDKIVADVTVEDDEEEEDDNLAA